MARQQRERDGGADIREDTPEQGVREVTEPLKISAFGSTIQFFPVASRSPGVWQRGLGSSSVRLREAGDVRNHQM